MNRIYLRHIDTLLASNKRSRVFLSYLKIRISSKGRCGGFNLSQLIESLQVSDTTARKALKGLIKYEYASEIKKGLYKVNSFKKIIGDNLHEKFFKISDEQIFSYSWKNISHFMALLVELRVQKNRNTRRQLRKGYKVIDRHGAVDTIRSQSNSEFDTLVSSNYASKITGRSYSTILRYRHKQDLVKYSSKKIYTYKLFKSEEEVTKQNLHLGKEFTFGNLLVFVPISTRYGSVLLNGY
jgi:hypothetical protein